VRTAPTIVGVWENYKVYLERGNNLALWHRVVPSFFTLDDHEILDNVFGSGTAGFRHRRAVFRDIGVQGWYDYLAWSNPPLFRQDAYFGEAELKAALSRREIARSHMSRAEALLAKGTFTQLDLEQAALDLANAEADVVAARVSVENARIAVDDTDVRAPITGTVILKPVERGQVISSPTRDVAGGSPLMQMADLSEVRIRALIDETDIGKIRAGMPATVSVAAYPNQPFPGEVVKVEPQAVVEQAQGPALDRGARRRPQPDRRRGAAHRSRALLRSRHARSADRRRDRPEHPPEAVR
jgi:hypothetical protein